MEPAKKFNFMDIFKIFTFKKAQPQPATEANIATKEEEKKEEEVVVKENKEEDK